MKNWRLCSIYITWLFINSLTRIFWRSCMGDDLLVNRYNEWVSQLDENAESAINKLTFDLEDAKYRISKYVKKSQIKPSNDKLTTIDDNFTLILPSMIGITQESNETFWKKEAVVPSVKVAFMQDLIHNQRMERCFNKRMILIQMKISLMLFKEAGVKNVGNFVKMRNFAKEQKAFIFDGIVFLNSV